MSVDNDLQHLQGTFDLVYRERIVDMKEIQHLEHAVVNIKKKIIIRYKLRYIVDKVNDLL